MDELAATLRNYTDFFNSRLADFFPLPAGAEKRVVEAMLYSVSNGGKRLRPFLIAETAALFGVGRERSVRTAAAVEMLHSYSLIHDDLPAMDNDDLRRGKPTCHKKFDEATAILAGDGLLTYAFEILSDPRTAADPAQRCELTALLAKAAGAFNGMVSGQMLDLYMERSTSFDEPETLITQIEEMKTGCLLRFSCEAGAVLGRASSSARQALVTYSLKIGCAFQIADDILDIEGNPSLMGKTLHKDAKQGKLTFVSLYGLNRAKEIASRLVEEAKLALAPFGKKAQTLHDLADYIIHRQS